MALREVAWGGAPAGGWTLYPPLSLQGGYNVAFAIFAIHMMGISSIMGAINIIATILNMRAPGVDLLKMPIFCWTWLITAFLLIAVMPVLAGCVTMMLMDIHFGTSFFSAAGGGDHRRDALVVLLQRFEAVPEEQRGFRFRSCRIGKDGL